MREQPDNIKSFNIVAETAQFVNLVYSNINGHNIDLCVQLFETLNEFTVVREIKIRLKRNVLCINHIISILQGNQLNRSVMLNSKIIDYINFILRAAEFCGCSIDSVSETRKDQTC